MAGSKALRLGLLLGALLLGAFLRFSDLEAHRMSPDDGNYLFSARAHEVSADQGLAEDWAWFTKKHHLYPHSYLHQAWIRVAVRAGASYRTAVRADSAFLSLASALLVYLFARGIWPDRPWAALFGAALAALAPLGVWYGRTGWGQPGCSFFYLAMLFSAAWLFLGRSPARWRAPLATAGVALASLLAWGYHEMIAVHVVGLALYGLLEAWWRTAEPEQAPASGAGARLGRLLRQPALWLLWLACAPVGLLTLRIKAGSGFAERHWFEQVPEGRGNFLDVKLANLEALFVRQPILNQLGWGVAALAVFGLVLAWKRDRRVGRLLAVALATGTGLFLAFFKDAFLVRIYLPMALLATLLAGLGLEALLAAARRRGLGLAFGAASLAFFGWQAAASAATVRGTPDHPLYRTSLETPRGFEPRDPKDADRELVETLVGALAPGEIVGVAGTLNERTHQVYCEYSSLFRLLDAGVDARPFALHWPEERWPRFVVGVAATLEREGWTVEAGGPYEEVLRDRYERQGLYRRRDG